MLDLLSETAEVASGKLEDVKTATETTAQGVEKRREQDLPAVRYTM